MYFPDMLENNSPMQTRIKAKPTGDIITPAGKLYNQVKSKVLHRE